MVVPATMSSIVAGTPAGFTPRAWQATPATMAMMSGCVARPRPSLANSAPPRAARVPSSISVARLMVMGRFTASSMAMGKAASSP